MDTDAPRDTPYEDPPTDHTYTTAQLAEWLLVNSEYMVPAETAAVTLLIQHRVWLDRPDFRRTAVILDHHMIGEVTCARIDFDCGVRAVEAWRRYEAGAPREDPCLDHHIGDGAVQVLRFAALLWSGLFTFTCLEPRNMRLAVEAIAHAGRKELLGGHLVDLKI